MKASEIVEQSEFIKTGFPLIDDVFGGGLPTRKIVEIAGWWSVGKSTLAYQMIAAAQKQDKPCLLLDAERAYTNAYGAALGIDNTQLDLFRAATEWIEGDKKQSLKPHKGGLVVIDAIGALLPREEAEKTSEGRSIGLQARIIGSFCRKIVPVLDDNNATLLVLNHTFIPLGQMGVASSGGKKLEFARSAWLILGGAYGEQIKKSADGRRTLIPMQIEVKKNKIVPNQGKKIRIDLIQGSGFVSEAVLALEKKRPGRPKKEEITS